MLRDASDRILLERRPPSGIWGGLWSLPELAADDDANAALRARFGEPANALRELPAFEHAFTHFRLRITPLIATLRDARPAIGDDGDRRWVDPAARAALGLPRPIASLLERIDAESVDGPLRLLPEASR